MTVDVLVDDNFELTTEVGPHQKDIEAYIANKDQDGLIRVNKTNPRNFIGYLHHW